MESLEPDEGVLGLPPAERPSDLLDQIPSPVLRAAARRVAAAWSEADCDDAELAEITEDLHTLAVSLTSGTPEPSAEPAGRSAARQHLLSLLRSEVVGAWREREQPPEPREMLDLLASFEQVRAALQLDSDHDFASRLMGPAGLEHLMEIAHDLRSPLTSVLFLAETLRRGQSGPINDIQHRQLGIVYSAALGLTSVVSDVIELARGGNRLMEKDPSPFSVTETLESVRDIVRPIAEEKGLTMRLLPPVSDQRLGYPVALSRVLLNLTSNALKFTDEGSVEILARAKGASRVEFSVRDTGNGIKPDLLKSLYRPFRRTRTGNGYAFSGSGLGLAICRKLVEAMGSELQLETSPEWGTRFYFDLELPPVSL